jgi:hypothetical protein
MPIDVPTASSSGERALLGHARTPRKGRRSGSDLTENQEARGASVVELAAEAFGDTGDTIGLRRRPDPEYDGAPHPRER